MSERSKSDQSPNREIGKRTVFVVTNDGRPDAGIQEILQKRDPDVQLVFLNAYGLPDQPPPELKNSSAYINIDPKFTSEQQKKNWAGIGFTRFIWRPDGSLGNFSSHEAEEF